MFAQHVVPTYWLSLLFQLDQRQMASLTDSAFPIRLSHASVIWYGQSAAAVQTLQAPEWGLGQEEAESLFNALLCDIGGTDGSKVIVIYKCPVPDT